ncbi:NAD(P)-dependent oxidoreductase [Myceligenerans indicum]|uniref:NAD(P)-dependent oxidoreductase n=1 Tax=Myceligenerans indicum TaxID=2593663 RepID=A0ABS1LIB4_9MICO|nr:NAD(P)-dependent oxidoreductase [Myceligenerans indicum]MBL0885937.1 NAD(P)-dependent oxidoreductase [Myceligenerans indicum]
MANDQDVAVGWIGLGDQGAPMARAIAEAGYELHVWARRPSSLEELRGVPFTVHDTPAALGAACEIVGLCLNVDDNVREVLTDGGLLGALRAGAVLVNHGTGLPAFARELAALAEPHEVAVLDAPVSGGRAGAVAKQLTTIVGGDRAALTRCTPVFESFSAKISHMGGAGAGQMAKLLNNALLMANQESLREIVRVASDLGIEVAPLMDLLRSGTGSSRALESLGHAITPGNAEHLREMQLVDMEIFADAVAELGESVRPFTERAVDGARALPELAAQVGWFPFPDPARGGTVRDRSGVAGGRGRPRTDHGPAVR